MKLRAVVLCCLLAATLFAAPVPRVVTLAGTMVDTTADAFAPATLVLTVEGDRATATLKVAPPLAGEGTLQGSFRQGWIEIAGRISATTTVQLRGVMNALDFRGTYLAGTPGEPVHYGRFEFAAER
jgi:hypothetical protein